MPVAPADLLQPKGRIDPEFFPDDADETALEARLQAYLDDGALEATVIGATDMDRATKAWAYHRAYATIAERLAAAPQTSSVDGEFTATYSSGQTKMFQDLATHYLGAFNALGTAREPLEENADDTMRSSSTRIGVRFRF